MSNRFIITGVLQIQAPRNLGTIVSQINRQLAGIQANINVNINSNAQRNINNFVNNINNARTAVRQFSTDVERAGFQAGRTLRRYAGFTFATGAFIQLGRAISAGIGDALDYEKTLNKIRQVTGTATRDLGGLNNEIVRLSTSFGVSSKKIAESALTLSQAGLSAEKTKVALEALAKSELSATFDDIQDTTEGAIAVFQQFNVEAQDLEKVLGSINTVSAKFAVESSDIITAIRRTGGAFQAAGGNLNELMALFTSVRQTTRESAESIATGFRTIFTRLQRTRTQDFLKTLGIDTRDIEGQFVGPYEAIKRLSEALRNVSTTDPRFSQIVEELGGFRQVSKVIPLIQKFDVSQRALNIAQRSGNSISEDAAKAQDTLANKIAKVGEEFAALLRSISATQTFKAFADVALNLASAFIKLADSLAPLIPLIAAFGAVKLGGTISQFGRGFKAGISGFASGGLVPGTGSGDTVPAMLTPGEFVIRKDAVKSIGASRLAQVNKRAEGGLISPIKVTRENKAAIKQQLIDAGGNENDVGRIVNKLVNQEITPTLFNQIIASSKNKQVESAEKKLRTSEREEIKKTSGGNPSIGTLTAPAIAGLFVDPLSGDSKDANTKIKFSTLKNDGIAPLITQKTGLAEFNELEVPIAKEYINPDLRDKISTGFIDKYIGLVNNEAKDYIPNPGFNKNRIVKSQLNSIGGYFFENIIGAVTNQFAKEGAGFDFKPANKAGLYSKLFGDKFGNYAVADAKYEFNENSKTSLREKTLKELGDINSPLYDFINPKRFAKGGAVDSVPAMLTPGEFVINKKAAASIGRAGLERLNKGVEKFATGGVVGSITSSPEKSLLVFSVITQFIAQMGDTNDTLKNLTAGFSALAVQVSVFKTVVDNIKNIGVIKNVSERINGLRTSDRFERAAGRIQQFDEIDNMIGPLTPDQVVTQTRLRRTRSADLDLVQKEAAENLRKRNRANLIGNVATYGGAAASFFGSKLEDSSLARIKSGNGGQGDVNMAGVGGFLSGGGQGAAIGSALGPYGALVGLVAGAAYGWINSVKQAEEALNKANFDKKFDNFTKNLDKITSGKLTASSGSLGVQRGISDINARLLVAKGEDRETLKGQISNSIVALETFLNKTAEGSKTLEQFKTTAGNAIAFFAQNTEQSVNEVINTYKKQIEIQKKALEIDNNIINLRVKEYQTLRAGLSITTAFERASSAADDLFNEFSSLVNVVEGNVNAFQATTNAFKGGDAAAINKQSSAIGNIFGAGARDIVSKVQEVGRLQNELPDILLGLKNKAPLEGEGFVQTLVDELRGRGFNNPDVIGSVRAIGEQKLVGREGKDVEAINELFKDLTGASKDLLRSFEPLVGIFENAQEKINTFLNQYSKLLQESIKIQQKEFEANLKLIDVYEQIGQIIATVKGEQFSGVPFEQVRKQRVTGGLDATQLSGFIQQAQNNVKNITAQINTAANPRDRVNLENQKAQEELAIVRATNALEFLADVANRAAPYLKQLESLSKLKEFTSNAAKTLVAGSAQEQRDLSKGIFGAAKIFTNKSFSGLTPAVAKAGIDVLTTLQDVPTGKDAQGKDVFGFKDRLRDAISNDLQTKFGINKKQADIVAEKSLLPQEERIAKALAPILDEAAKAQGAIVKLYGDANTQLIKGLRDTFDKFIGDLRANFEKENRESKIKLGNEIDNRNAAVDAQLTARQTLVNRAGINPDEASVQKVISAVPQIQELKKLQDQQSTLSRTKFLNSSSTFANNLLGKSVIGNLGQTKLFSKDAIGKQIESGELFNKLSEKFGNAQSASKVVGKFQGKLSELGNAPVGVGEVLQKLILEEVASLEKELPGKIGELNATIGKLVTDPVKDNVVRNLNEISLAITNLGGKSLDELNKAKTVNNAEKAALGLNTGGPIPGAGNTDTVPAMLTPGEFVIRKEAAAQIGLDNLHKMNATGYASGGLVTPKEQKRRLQEARDYRRKFGRSKLDDFKRKRNATLPNGIASPDQIANPMRSSGGGLPQGIYNLKLNQARLNLGLPEVQRNESSRNIAGLGPKNSPAYRAEQLAKARERVEQFKYTKQYNSQFSGRKKFANGGPVGGGSGTGGGGLTINQQSLSQFNNSVNQFSTSSDRLAQSLDNFPREITMTASHKVEFIINGAQVLTNIMPEIQKMIEVGAKDTLNKFIKDKMPDVGEIQ